jgi:endoglucanase
MLRRSCALVTVALVSVLGQAALGQAALGHAAAPAKATARAKLRVDQAGYVRSAAKQAVLMTSRPAGGARFQLKRNGHVVRTGTVSKTDRGSWNSTYQHTYAVTFTGLRKAGSYRLVVHSTPQVSAKIRVATIASIYRTVLIDGVKFDQVQRDGKHVIPGPLHRAPSHLHDAHATVYKTWPAAGPTPATI